MTIFFASHEITIYRNRRKGNTDRYGMSATFTAYSADIQPASVERIEMVAGRFGAVFDAYVDEAVEVREGDQVVVTDTGKRYSVKGVTQWHGASLLGHTQIVLVSLDGNE